MIPTKLQILRSIKILCLLLFPYEIIEAQMSQHLLEPYQPRYEVGVGFINLNLPHYPGSNSSKMRIIPFPWLVYRGKRLRIDEEGQRARIKFSNKYEISMTPYINFPVRSGDGARKGMPNLDYLLGLGPQFILRLSPEKSPHYLSTTISAVGTLSTNFTNRLNFEGIIIAPRLRYWYRLPQSPFTIFSSLYFQFGSSGINRFFYEVPSSQSTPERPNYQAKPGLIKMSTSIGMGLYLKNLFVFTSSSFQSLAFSENRSSPLVETQNNVSFILGAVWTFWESEEKVRRILSK